LQERNHHVSEEEHVEVMGSRTGPKVAVGGRRRRSTATHTSCGRKKTPWEQVIDESSEDDPEEEEEEEEQLTSSSTRGGPSNGRDTIVRAQYGARRVEMRMTQQDANIVEEAVEQLISSRWPKGKRAVRGMNSLSIFS
jgi:hypothetical protein